MAEHSKFLSLQIFQLNTPQKKHLLSPFTTEIGFAGESKEKMNKKKKKESTVLTGVNTAIITNIHIALIMCQMLC